jgi:hypothetical protein
MMNEIEAEYRADCQGLLRDAQAVNTATLCL